MNNTIAIIDADIIGKKKHRFPNLVCMKLSAYYKQQGFIVEFKTNYENINLYYKVFISKVFTDTEVNKSVLELANVEYGGTGFFYDKAPKLPIEIEHTKPDYTLYMDWVNECINNGAKEKEFTYYKNYSIGFLTKGCFRQCEFCVNRNCKTCEVHSNVLEFYDESRPKLCFLDDNFFANSNWKEIIKEVKLLNKPFQFKQGLDERLLTEYHIHELASWKKYDGAFIFAFDDIKDKNLIEKKLSKIFQLYPNFKKGIKFYVFCGFDRNDVWDFDFWINDIKDIFSRCFILAKYSAVPYLMRYNIVYDTEYSTLYSTIASWCNQPQFFKKMTFRQYAIFSGMPRDEYKRLSILYKEINIIISKEQFFIDNYKGKKRACWRAMEKYEEYFKHMYDIAGDMLLEHGNGKKMPK